MTELEGRQRAVIEGVKPEIDGGRFPAKRTVGETVVVEADIFTDGHDELSAVLRYRREEDEVERWLNERSGLLGLSGLSHDMRELLVAAGERRDAGAESAIALFCHRARKYLGAYLAVLGGADAIVFGGGIGERSPEIRARICDGMDWCGLVLDRARNLAARDIPPGGGACISHDGVRLPAYVVAVDEETAIAREARLCLGGEGAS